MLEYSKDGTNKRINISAFSEEEENSKSLEEEEASPVKEEKISKKEQEFVGAIKSLIPRVSEFLQTGESSEREQTFGITSQVFGRVRLEAVEFLKISIEKFSKHLSSSLIELNIFKTLVQFFFDFPNHSILHLKLSDIIKCGLKSE